MENARKLAEKYSGLLECTDAVEAAAQLMIDAFEKGNRLYLCGNGGSAADADHIVGELMKGFKKRRPLDPGRQQAFGEDSALADGLMVGLPAISLHSQSSLLTAFMNDADPSLVYAQTLYSLGQSGDLLIAISTSGNSDNIVKAAKVAKALGIKVISLTGKNACLLDPLSDVVIHVGETETYLVQELHLPVYHWLCSTVEEHFFKE